MNVKKIGIIICFLIILAFSVMIVIFSYKQSGNYDCNYVLDIKADAGVLGADSTVRLFSLGTSDFDVLFYNNIETNSSKTEFVDVESIYPIIKITKFNGDKIIIDLYSNEIYTIKSGIVETYSANIYKDKYNAIYVEAIDENKNILSTVFGNNSKFLYFGDSKYVCDNYLRF